MKCEFTVIVVKYILSSVIRGIPLQRKNVALLLLKMGFVTIKTQDLVLKRK